MTPEDVIKQHINAAAISSFMDTESNYDDPVSFLNLLAITGFKLVALSEEDFDDEGLSVVSKAYMLAVIETIEGSHSNIHTFREDKDDLLNSSDDDEDEEDDEDFEDDLDEDIWDNLGDED